MAWLKGVELGSSCSRNKAFLVRVLLCFLDVFCGDCFLGDLVGGEATLSGAAMAVSPGGTSLVLASAFIAETGSHPPCCCCARSRRGIT